MANTGHSVFPASASARLLACPGSLDLGIKADTGERRSTVFSAEGTLAHSISEAMIYSGSDPIDLLGRTFRADGFEFVLDEAFLENVSVYVDYVRGLQALGYIVALETRVSPSIHWTGMKPLGLDLFGTADCIAYHPGTGHLIIADLKFGRGIAVTVGGNPQLLYYSAGTLSTDFINFMLTSNGHPRVPANWLPKHIETVVIQPRAYHPDGPTRREVYTKDEVVNWSRDVLYQGVQTAINDNGATLKPGDHCRFCPALAHCPAAKSFSLDAAKLAFLDTPLENTPLDGVDTAGDIEHQLQQHALAILPATHISDKDLGELLDKFTIMKPFMAAIEQLADSRLKATRDIPGWKIVPTKTRRVWADDIVQITATLEAAGVDPALFVESKLLTPAQAERKMGKNRFATVAGAGAAIPLIRQSNAGTTLAPEGDPRARIAAARTAQQAFGIAP